MTGPDNVPGCDAPAAQPPHPPMPTTPAATPGAHRAVLSRQPCRLRRGHRGGGHRRSHRADAAGAVEGLARRGLRRGTPFPAVDGAGGHHRPVPAARRGSVHGPVRAGLVRQPRRAGAARRDVRAPAQRRTGAVHAAQRQQPDQHHGLRGAGRCQLAGAGAAGDRARLVDDRGAVRLPAVAELETDAAGGAAGAGGGAGDARGVAAARPPDARAPGRHRRAGLRGRGERAGLAHRAPARCGAGAEPALRHAKPMAAPADGQVGRGRGDQFADHAVDRRGGACRPWWCWRCGRARARRRPATVPRSAASPPSSPRC